MTRFHASRLRASLVEVVGALATRPAPRDVWDDLARRDSEFRCLWLDKDVQLCRAALCAATAEGQTILSETARRIDRYFEERKAAALYGYDVQVTMDLQDSILALTHESADVIVAAAEVRHETTEGKLEALRSEAMEAERATEEVIARVSERLAQRPQSRVAHR